MPLYMDIHEIAGVTPEALAKAHEADVSVQGKYGVNYLKYWLNESCGKVFCLVEAPNAEAAARVHQEAHGFEAERIIEVQPPELAEGFLGGGQVNSAGAVVLPDSTHAHDTAFRTVLFTDIVNSTSLTQTLGDEQAMEFIRLHDTIVRDALAANTGREIKHTGDGIMASFCSAVAAVRCAAQIQRALAEKQTDRGLSIKVRIGGAAGEPVERNNDIFGSTVQLASRLCSHAEADQILVSNVVAELCIGKGLPFRALGEVTLRGFDRPVNVHAVDWPQTA